MHLGPKTLRAFRVLAVVGGAEIVGKVAALTMVVLVARLLGVEQFGVFAYGLGLGQLAAALAMAGFNVPLIQRGSARPEQLAGILAQVLVLRLLLTVALLAISVLAVVVSRPEAAERTTILLLVAASFLDVFTAAYRAACTAREQQGPPAVLFAVQRVLTTVLVSGALIPGLGLQGAGAGYLAGCAVGLIAMVVLSRKLGVVPDFTSVTPHTLWGLLTEAWPAGVQTLVTMSLMRIDIVILGALAGDTAVGAYSAVYRLLETVLFLGWSVNRVVFPIMAAAQQNWSIRVGMRRGTSLLCFFLFPYGLLLLARGDDLLELLYGNDFAIEGAPIVAWLAIAPVFASLGYLSSSLLFARGRDLRPVTASVIALGVNLAMNLALIPSLGGTGAAMATTVSYGIQAVIAYTFLWRWVGRVISIAGVGVLLVSCVPVATVLLLPGHILLVAPLSAVAYVAAWYPLAHRFDPEQVHLLGAVRPGRSRL